MLNRCRFNSLLNVESPSAWRTEGGKLFHARGPATENPFSPNIMYVRGNSRCPAVDDLSDRLEAISETGWQRSANTVEPAHGEPYMSKGTVCRLYVLNIARIFSYSTSL